MIKNIIEVITRYGNLIDYPTQKSLAYEISIELEEQGFLNEDGKKALNNVRKTDPKENVSNIFDKSSTSTGLNVPRPM